MLRDLARTRSRLFDPPYRASKTVGRGAPSNGAQVSMSVAARPERAARVRL